MPSAAEMAAALLAREELPPEQGEMGLPGLPGRDGDVGPQGLEGPIGPIGPDGPAGRDGKDGADGKVGKRGPKGEKGDDGADGRPGKDGAAAGIAGGRGFPRGLSSGMVIDDEGTRLNSGTVLGEVNFAGAGVTVTQETGPSGARALVTIPGGGGGSSLTVLDDGTPLDTAVSSIDLTGTGISATNVAHAVTVVVDTPDLEAVLTEGNDAGGIAIHNTPSVTGADDGSAEGGVLINATAVAPNGGNETLQGGTADTGGTGGRARLLGGSADGGTGARVDARGASATDPGILNVRTAGGSGVLGEYLGSDDLGGVIWATPSFDALGAAAAAQAASQPLDSDLTAIAALATTAYGRAFLALADAAAARTALALGTLATQSGTFSGTSSGTNTGDQTLTGLGGITLPQAMALGCGV